MTLEIFNILHYWALTVKIDLVQKDGKWDIPSSQQKNIQSLITAFWVGFSDEKDVATALSQAVVDLY